ncbi:unnamed protein product [Paramecium sonneborni]|uniref:Uncharacterized protein n=1 Tax=Paramecium sonneborni TaxID=65129 RepID=A0A8S1LPI0_9CILI|nr:unnamed protein product [Paramecium sonneborni]
MLKKHNILIISIRQAKKQKKIYQKILVKEITLIDKCQINYFKIGTTRYNCQLNIFNAIADQIFTQIWMKMGFFQNDLSKIKKIINNLFFIFCKLKTYLCSKKNMIIKCLKQEYFQNEYQKGQKLKNWQIKINKKQNMQELENENFTFFNLKQIRLLQVYLLFQSNIKKLKVINLNLKLILKQDLTNSSIQPYITYSVLAIHQKFEETIQIVMQKIPEYEGVNYYYHIKLFQQFF